MKTANMEEITSRKNTLVRHLKKLGTDGDYRRQSGEFLCDGDKLLREAVLSGAVITAVLTGSVKPDFLPDGVPVYHAPRDIIEAASPLKTPQDVVFSCALPAPDKNTPTSGLQLILEEIQDPGNIGTILRTAGAFNVTRMILTGNCADPYGPKAVRASMGAIFRLVPVTRDLDGIARLKEAGIKLYAAALGENCADVREADYHNAAVAIGSEGRGLSMELLDLCDDKIKIPMADTAESLNAAAAAAIIMWEAAKAHGL